jgi:DNA-nicking Smr family endonuclease
MTPRHVDLHGLTLAEAEAKVRALVADAQEESLANFEIEMIDHGADPEDLAATLAGQRAQHVRWREELMARWREMALRGSGGELN